MDKLEKSRYVDVIYHRGLTKYGLRKEETGHIKAVWPNARMYGGSRKFKLEDLDW